MKVVTPATSTAKTVPKISPMTAAFQSTQEMIRAARMVPRMLAGKMMRYSLTMKGQISSLADLVYLSMPQPLFPCRAPTVTSPGSLPPPC